MGWNNDLKIIIVIADQIQQISAKSDSGDARRSEKSVIRSKKISNDKELTQSDPIFCPPPPKKKKKKQKEIIHKLTAVYERYARYNEWTAPSQTGGHSAT